MNKLAIIPARGGSKRIPHKNIKLFCGKPMLAWSIEAAKASGCFERIIVSSDDAEIISIAREYGAEAPFIRPPELSGDFAGTIPVISHAIQNLRDSGWFASQVCCIYATAPFLQAGDLLRGLQIMDGEDCDYAFSVTTFPYPIQRSLYLKSDGRVDMFYPENFHVRSQDLKEAYHDAGQFCWGTAKAWLEEKPVFLSDAMPVLLPRYRVQDIDTMEDWERAEWLFKSLHRTNEGV